MTEQSGAQHPHASPHPGGLGSTQPPLPHSVLRTVSEDPRLRPFLSTHFEAASFVTNSVQFSAASDSRQPPATPVHKPRAPSKAEQAVPFAGPNANAGAMLGFVSQMIEETNHEIQSYISQHKAELMAGMQDIAMFADQCKSLHEWILQVQKSVEVLKAEVPTKDIRT